MERCEIVYRMSADASVDGIAVHQVADVMYAFAEAVDEAMKLSGGEGELKVNVKPFKQGSFITEFVVTYAPTLTTIFSSSEANALANVLDYLGFMGIGISVPIIIKKTRGRIDKCVKNDTGTYTYGDGEDAVEVDETAHRIIQSPKVAKALKTIAVGPLINIDNSINVTIQSREEFDAGDNAAGSRFCDADVPSMDSYEHIAVEGVPEDKEDVVTTMHNVVLRPMAGPYDGGENGYTFMCEDAKWKRVEMHDLEFRMKLESSEVRFAQRDLLFADVETTTSITKSGKESVSYRITRVLDYRRYKPVEQLSIGGGQD